MFSATPHWGGGCSARHSHIFFFYVHVGPDLRPPFSRVVILPTSDSQLLNPPQRTLADTLSIPGPQRDLIPSFSLEASQSLPSPSLVIPPSSHSPNRDVPHFHPPRPPIRSGLSCSCTVTLRSIQTPFHFLHAPGPLVFSRLPIPFSPPSFPSVAVPGPREFSHLAPLLGIRFSGSLTPPVQRVDEHHQFTCFISACPVIAC